MSDAGPILQAAYENSPPFSWLPKWHLARAAKLVVDEEGLRTLDSVVKCVCWYNKAKRPLHFHRSWPNLNFIAQRSRRFKTIIKGFVDRKHTVIWCVKSNAIARLDEKEIRQEFPKLKVVRILSKAQHLIERLELLGIQDFKLVYDQPKSPYAVWTVNVVQTLHNLRSAIDAHGFGGLDHEEIWYQEYEDYETPPLPKNVNVVIYTNTRFTVSLRPHRKPW